MLKRALVFLPLYLGACVKSSLFAWRCDDPTDAVALAPIVDDNLSFESHVSSIAWWDEGAWKKGLDVWTTLSSYYDVIASQEPGVQRSSQEMSSDLLHLTREKLEDTMEFMIKLVRLYEPSRIILSFNGGKDATVCLSLYVAALAYLTRHTNPRDRAKPKAVWFRNSDEFEIVSRFVMDQVEYWDLDLTVVNGNWEKNIRPYVAHLGVSPHPLFIIGVRSTDFEDSQETLGALKPSDLSLDAIYMRAHPILSWDYGMVWDYMGLTGVPYCPLYDMGYSSIGKLGESEPNENLRKDTDWKRASELCVNAWGTERFGRKQKFIEL